MFPVQVRTLVQRDEESVVPPMSAPGHSSLPFTCCRAREVGICACVRVCVHSLAAVRVPPMIRHTQQAPLIKIPPAQILIRKLPSINRVTAPSIAKRYIPALHHELVNDAVEGAALVRERRLFARTQHSEAVSYKDI